MSTPTRGPQYTADELSAALGEQFTPTPQQRAVIEAPLSPMLVTAGAGSGKTKTMADRVVYLVANGLVMPHEILGVTFTRKAAGELAERITGKLTQLVEKELISAADIIPAELVATLPEDSQVQTYLSSLLEPTISTYHSYAHSLVAEYGMHIGIEPDAELVGGAAAWQLITPLITDYPEGEALVEAEANTATLAEQVLKLSQDMAEHLQSPERVVAWLDQQISQVEPWQPLPNGDCRNLLRMLKLRRETAKLTQAYQQAKAENGLMDYGDLLRYAARLATEVEQVRVRERQKYKIVLLDEFQDTSHAQLELFSHLFGSGTGHAVTAVGDPNQSIYGFRGASAGQLFQFPEKFVLTTEQAKATSQPSTDHSGASQDGEPGLKQLTIAWRNGRRILDVANTLVEPFTQDTGLAWHASTAHLRGKLQQLITADRMAKDGTLLNEDGTPQGAPAVQLVPEQDRIVPPHTVKDGSVAYGFFTSEAQETAAIVEEMKRQLAVPEGQEPPNCAVLATTHGQLATVADALRYAGVPYELASLSGLLHQPEVVELIAYLRVLADPKRSDELIRILAGARYRIGPKDLYQLGRSAAGLASSRSRGRGRDADEEQVESLEPELDEMQSLVEALENFQVDPEANQENRYGFSAEGARRLSQAREHFRALRGLLHLDLGTLIHRISQETGLGVEVSARPWEPGSHPTRQIDTLIEYAQAFATSSSSQDITAFLDWLEAAEEQERGLEQAPADPAPGAVQLLTVHASKGLEWDVVAVAGLREGKFPKPARMVSRWTKNEGDLPWPLRGDRDSLPQWTPQYDDEDPPKRKAQVWARSEGTAKSPKDYEGPLFTEDAALFAEEEERRLAYVAFTRAKTRLLVTGACFYGASAGKDASVFLKEIRRLAQQSPHPEGFEELAWHSYEQEEANPQSSHTLISAWPYDPLAARRVTRKELQKADLTDHTSVDTFTDPAEAAPGSPAVYTRRPALQEAADLVTSYLHRDEHSEELEENQWLEEARLVTRRAAARSTMAEPAQLPGQLAVSSVVQLAHNRQQVLEQARRPIPQKPSSAARRGTAIHGIIEQVLEVQGALPEIDELFAAHLAEDEAGELDLEQVRASYHASPWAQWPAFAVEIPLETSLAGVTLRGRIDAVFAKDAKGIPLSSETYHRWMAEPKPKRNELMSRCSFDLVDWKTGAVPTGEDMKEKELQLAVYRVAFSRLYGVSEQNIRCHFLYLDQGVTHSPQRLEGAAELARRIKGEDSG
ncbi:UvrD-helicase domain-containing protein [Nesterenkonia alkaliphila]|uniref:DNA 3'-5' helicase n=1 Tax=Nesterenkonia alkaliphila TaxID=1463631 RepID=A0A7K1UHW9_9MICC|nr:UvrD-helicase domain-containing protein [Nesterenkonia alkaliphila]MVT25691.1 AAA family ATPase [Nesterenkonia alkaliphila]GFZ85129.1 ATP-dependent DNA helicase [Nesterenkonia alkaliphila]